jgi:hypothetical protein
MRAFRSWLPDAAFEHFSYAYAILEKDGGVLIFCDKSRRIRGGQ